MSALTKKILSFFTVEKAGMRQVYASHAAFYVVVSSIPMLLLILQVFSRLSPEGSEKLLLWMLSSLPGSVADVLPREIFATLVGASFPLISVTAFTLVWSSSKGLRAVSAGLRAVYGASERSSYIRRYLISLVFTLFFLFVTVFALCVLVLGPSISAALFRSDSVWSKLSSAVTRLGWLFAFGIFTLSFALLYRFAAESPLPFRRHLPGSACAAFGWLVLSALLSLYLRFFRPYTLYGGLGALLLLMLWVRFCMSILLFGAEINVYLDHHPLFVVPRREDETQK